MHSLLTLVGREVHGEASGSCPCASRQITGVHQQITLNRATVAGLKLNDGKTDQIVFDADLKGFGFRMRLDGARAHRSWIIQYRNKGGGTRRLKIGDYPTVSADQARIYWEARDGVSAALELAAHQNALQK
jgi:hypothetical protein